MEKILNRLRIVKGSKSQSEVKYVKYARESHHKYPDWEVTLGTRVYRRTRQGYILEGRRKSKILWQLSQDIIKIWMKTMTTAKELRRREEESVRPIGGMEIKENMQMGLQSPVVGCLSKSPLLRETELRRPPLMPAEGSRRCEGLPQGSGAVALKQV